VNILWVKSGGFLPLDAGGKIRSFSIARELAHRHNLTVFTFYPQQSDDPHYLLNETFHRVECLPVPTPERESLVDVLGYAANACTNYPYQMRKYCRPVVARRLRQILREQNYDVLLCDYLLTAGVVPFDTPIPVVIFTHNVEAMLWQRRCLATRNPLKKAIAWREYRTIDRQERRLTNLADHIFTVSDQDRQVFLDFLLPQKVTTVPTGVDLEYFKPRSGRLNTKTLVFTGSMDWLPNEDAMMFFCQQILPLIQKKVGDVQLRIVGKKPTKKVIALQEKYPNVEVTGAVDDIRGYLADSAVCIVPIRIGGGTRIKIFEAMAMGKPVVSTSIGAEGLGLRNNENIILADNPEDFAERTTALLLDQMARTRLGKAGRAYVENHCSWQASADVVDNTLRELATKPTRSPRLLNQEIS
jgi:sugar transferase (PEP-CTERM/EpsH1 system associated)